MLRLGKRLPWQDALETITGQRDMSVQPILKFFQPLHDWLEATNQANGDVIGWEFSGGLASSTYLPSKYLVMLTSFLTMLFTTAHI